MYLTLAVDDDSVPAQYEGLFDWLATEPDLRPLVRLEKRPPASGELGGVIDALSIAVESGGALTVLAGALGAWLSRVRNRSMRVEVRERANGDRSVVFDTRNTKPADIERMLRALNGGVDE
jgi:hypothetical protein